MKPRFIGYILAALLVLAAVPAGAYMLAGILGPGSGGVAPPSAPTVSASAGNAQITYTWSAASGATSYNLRYGTSTGTYGSTVTGVTSPYNLTSLTNGTTYYARLDAVNAGGSTQSSEVSATPAATSNGVLDFETTSLTPVGFSTAYTNVNTSQVTRSTTVAHGGSYSMKFNSVSSAPYAEMSRQVTFPASGVYSFERWFYMPTKPTTGAFQLFALALDASITNWDIGIFATSSNIYYYQQPSYTQTNLIAMSSLSTNTWYRLKTDLNAGSNTFTVTLYNASGTQLAQAANKALNADTITSATRYLWIGRCTEAGYTVYIDDILDGL